MSATLSEANAIIAGAFHKGQELGLAPLTVAVLDAGSGLIALARQDCASTLRPQIAIAKASGALALGMSSRKVGEMATERPQFFASLVNLAPHGIIPAAGGVIFMDTGDRIIGAVGVTGDTSDNDEQCALHGILFANLGVYS